MVERRPQMQGDLGALDDRGRCAWIEIEGQHGGPAGVGGRRQRRVQLQIGHVGEPHERGQILHEAVVDLAPLGGDRRGAHPLRPVRRALLLVEILGVDAVGIALERQRSPSQVRQQDGRDPRVVLDDLPLREADLGIEDLVEVDERQGSPIDVHLDAPGHAGDGTDPGD
jgi:hypothetical protein